MKEIKGNMFDHIGRADMICITTNGFVKRDGTCVMGRGCAAAAVKRWPNIATILGRRIATDGGNRIHVLTEDHNTLIASFPVKPISRAYDKSKIVSHIRNRIKPGERIPGWACIAELDIIRQSAYELVEIANKRGMKDVIIPRPGCGAGELSWDLVQPMLAGILDDRFSAITF